MTRHPLDRFNAWFSSAAGVWHTLIVTAAIVIGELAFPHLDPHGFWLLYWLTVYSAVTQPALAYSGRRSAQQTDRILTQMEEALEHLAALRGLRQDRASSDTHPHAQSEHDDDEQRER